MWSDASSASNQNQGKEESGVCALVGREATNDQEREAGVQGQTQKNREGRRKGGERKRQSEEEKGYGGGQGEEFLFRLKGSDWT